MGMRILKYIDILKPWCAAIPNADAEIDIYIATINATCHTSKLRLDAEAPRSSQV